MKLIFIDEFKRDKEIEGQKFDFYGLCAVVIDNAFYSKFKKGFYKKLQEIGWGKEIEIKGRFSFSKTKGDTNVSVEDRLIFVEELFELSKTGSGKYASAKVFYIFDFFSKEIVENEKYKKLFIDMFSNNNFLPKLKNGNNGKNNIAIFVDNNDCVYFDKMDEIENILNNKNYTLIEKITGVDSDNKTPGIIFADHVAYFIDNYLKLNDFNEGNRNRILELIEKIQNDTVSDNEKKEFEQYRISVQKEGASLKLLKTLKSMKFIKPKD